jgi:hypothetical protein
MGSGWPRLRPGGRGCDGGGRAPRRLAEIAAWGGVGCRVRDGTRRVVGVIRGPVFHLPPLEHFRTLLPNADPRGPAGGHAQDGTVDGVCHADPTPRARSRRGAWSFCEIRVIGLIRVGSSSTRLGSTHTKGTWSKTEHRLSRFHRLRRGPLFGQSLSPGAKPTATQNAQPPQPARTPRTELAASGLRIPRFASAAQSPSAHRKRG